MLWPAPPACPLAVTLSTAKLDPRFPQTNQTKVRGPMGRRAGAPSVGRQASVQAAAAAAEGQSVALRLCSVLALRVCCYLP